MRQFPFRPTVLLLVISAVAVPVTAFVLREDPATAEESESERKERKARKYLELMNHRQVMEETTVVSTEAFAKMGFDPAGGTPDVLVKKVQNEVSKWVDVARQKNIKVEP